jgi:hypothetical protein
MQASVMRHPAGPVADQGGLADGYDIAGGQLPR